MGIRLCDLDKARVWRGSGRGPKQPATTGNRHQNLTVCRLRQAMRRHNAPEMTAATASNRGKKPEKPRNKAANCEKPHINDRFCALICPLPGFGRRCRKWRTPALQEEASTNGEVAIQPERREAFIRPALIWPCSILLKRGAARKAVSHQHGEGGVPITGEVRAARPGLAFYPRRPFGVCRPEAA